MKKKLLSLLLSATMVFGLCPQMALAADDAGFTIEGSGNYNYEDGVLTVQDEADLTISTSGQTSHRIVVAENAEATIILNGVHITGESSTSGADPFSAIDIANNASLLLQLADSSTNSLSGGNGETGDGAPGIHVPEEAELTILGSGSLTVTGGTGGYGGSGIGGTHVPGPNLKAETCGTVIILATGEISNSGGESGPGSSPGNDIGGGKGLPEQAGGDGGGIRPTGNGSYVVWGEEALPEHPESYTIPEGATLTIPRDATLTIPQGVTLINNGTITGDGVIGGPGELTGSGVVTVDKNTFQKESALTLTVEGATTVGGITSTVYGSTITLKAKVEQADTRALSAGDYSTVTFYVGTDDSKKELGTAKVENNGASLTDVKIIAENGWIIGQNAITAVFSGHSHLKPATGTATLTVGKGPQTDPPDAPSGVSDITATSVTLTPVTGSDGKGNIQYGYTTDTMDCPYTWQSSPTFENLTPAMAYTFYTSYASNDFYLPSPSSTIGLKVVTAPAADAVTINCINEKITFDDGKLEVNSNKEFSNTPLSNNGTVTSRIGQKIYVRVKSENDANTPIRGITEIDVPVRPASPSNLRVVNVSAAGQQDGKIIGVSANMEYQKKYAASWTDCNGDTVENLAPGTYEVRTKATSAQFAGVSASVTIGIEHHRHQWDEKAWTSNENGTHTRKCMQSECNETQTENCSGGSSSCQSRATCSVCGGKYGPYGNHSYGDWKSDAKNHWKACFCGATTAKAEHSFGEWVVTKEATKAEDGSRERSCGTCAYKETEVIPALGFKPDDPEHPDRPGKMEITKAFTHKKGVRVEGVSENADGYEFSIRKGGDGQDYGKIFDMKECKYTFKDLKEDTRYVIRIRPYHLTDGVRIYGEKCFLTGRVLMKKADFTERPTVAKVTDAFTHKKGIRVDVKSSGAHGYEFYIRKGGENQEYTLVRDSKKAYCKMLELTEGQRYVIRIKPYAIVDEEKVYAIENTYVTGRAAKDKKSLK